VIPQNNRFWCYENGAIFYYNEMLNLLQSEARNSTQVSEAIITAWINLLRFEVVRLAGEDEQFSLSLQKGEGIILLKRFLAPKNWDKDTFGNQVARRTGLSYSSVCATFQKMSNILFELDGHKAFEPIGWFKNVPRAEGGGFRVHLWEDFPQPVSYKHEEEISFSEQLA